MANTFRASSVHGTETDRSVRAVEKPNGTTWNRVVVVSNRLPFKVAIDETGKSTLLPSAGGLVTAITPLLHQGIGGKWVGWPGTEEEEGLEEALRSTPAGQENRFDVGVVMLTAEEERGYYEGYANQVLAPVLVGETSKVDLANASSYWAVYQDVQRKFAEKIAEDLRPTDIVWVHDYHLMGVGKELRRLHATQPIGFFLHTPFPEKETLRSIPQYRWLLEALLAYDIVGFQTKRFERRFIDAIQRHVTTACVSVHTDGVQIRYRGHTTHLGSFPVSIDVDEFEHQLYARDTQRNVRRLDALLHHHGETQVILNVGRQDYAKGFLEELLAFDRLLEKHPDLIGKVLLFQLVVPSRNTIDAYREYKERIIHLANSINEKYGRKVVHQMHTHMGRARYLAHLHVADVQCVPTKADGMNLVAKESAIVGHPMTVLIIGKEAGVVDEFESNVLVINPDNTEDFADAIHRALTMRRRDRRDRKSALKSQVTAKDVFAWWAHEQEPLFQKIWDEKRHH